MKKKVSLTLINSKYFPQTWFFCFDSMNFVKCCSFRNHIYLVLKKMTQTHTNTQKHTYTESKIQIQAIKPWTYNMKDW